jgi:hypothetical protein
MVFAANQWADVPAATGYVSLLAGVDRESKSVVSAA